MQPTTNGQGGLSREQILAAIDLKIEAVEIPEWGGTVYVRNLTGKARDAFEATRYKISDDPQHPGKPKIEANHHNTRAALVAASVCDKDGNFIFSQADVEALGEKNGAVLDRLFDVAQRLSGMRKEDLEAARKN